VFYEDNWRGRSSRIGGLTLEKGDRPVQSQETAFASRLHEPLSREIRASQKYPGVKRWGAGGQIPGNDANQNSLPAPANQIERKAAPRSDGGEHPDFSEALIQEAISRFSAYMREERERYRSQARPLTRWERGLFGGFFSLELLLRVRVLALSGSRLANPSFYEKARTLGLTNLPDLAHKASATFFDVMVFNEQITDRKMFHALVHAAQTHVLGPRFFAELFVRGILRARSYSLAPMQAQAYGLDARFAANPGLAFSVEAEIRNWMDEARY
jgi:hypothetical protein